MGFVFVMGGGIAHASSLKSFQPSAVSSCSELTAER
jgi:hypothetical protein